MLANSRLQSIIWTSRIKEAETFYRDVLELPLREISDGTIEGLGNRGLAIERFDGMPHEGNGALVTPDGSRVAWFRDPDGNILSVVQFA